MSGTDGVLLSAGRNLAIVEARETGTETGRNDQRSSGLAGTFGGVPIPGSVVDNRGTARSTDGVAASTIVSSQGGVRITSNALTALQGVQVQAARTIVIDGGEVNITGALGTEQREAQRSTRGTQIDASGWHDLGQGIDARQTEIATRNAEQLSRTSLTGRSVSISSTGQDGASGDLTLAGTTVTAASLSLDAANTLRLNTQAARQVSNQSIQGRDLGWQETLDLGRVEGTTEYNLFNTASLSVTGKKIEVQVGQRPVVPAPAVAEPGAKPATAPITPEAALQATVATLAGQPGLAWMGQLQSDPALQGRVDWAAMTQAHDSWDFKQQGLTEEGAVIVTVVVAYFTAGAASGIGTVVGGAAAGTGTATATVIAGATAAAVTTLATQAAIALINNKGDVGKRCTTWARVRTSRACWPASSRAACWRA